MKKLVLIRHAAVKYPESSRFIGQKDVPADPDIISKLDRIDQYYKEYQVISSPLIRARSTAAALFGADRKIILCDNIKERGLGDWEGLSKEYVRKKHPECFSGANRIKYNITPTNGENIEFFLGRVSDFIKGISALNIVAITHNGVIAAARHLLNNESIEETYMHSTPHLSPIEFELDDSLLRS